MLNYVVVTILFLTFSEDELNKVNEALEIKATLEDEVEIGAIEFEMLFNAGLIDECKYNEIQNLEEELTKIIVCFEEGKK